MTRRRRRHLWHIEATTPDYHDEQRFIAKQTGTTYADGFTTRVKNLDTVCDGASLTNMRGAHVFTDATVADCRQTFGRDFKTVEARFVRKTKPERLPA